MCIRDRTIGELVAKDFRKADIFKKYNLDFCCGGKKTLSEAVSYTHLRAHETVLDLVCRLLLEKKHQ